LSNEGDSIYIKARDPQGCENGPQIRLGGEIGMSQKRVYGTVGQRSVFIERWNSLHELRVEKVRRGLHII
jgi:hypothetical protein